MIGVGPTRLYELIAAGEIETVKLGKATRVTTASLRDLVTQQRGSAIASFTAGPGCLTAVVPTSSR